MQAEYQEMKKESTERRRLTERQDRKGVLHHTQQEKIHKGHGTRPCVSPIRRLLLETNEIIYEGKNKSRARKKMKPTVDSETQTERDSTRVGAVPTSAALAAQGPTLS